MILIRYKSFMELKSCTRTSGDDPEEIEDDIDYIRLYPHKRG